MSDFNSITINKDGQKTVYNVADLTARTNASNAQSTANSAQTTASKAQTTAESANAAASKAQTTADSANTKATNNASAIADINSTITTLQTKPTYDETNKSIVFN